MKVTIDRKAPADVEADALIVLEFEDSSSLPEGYARMREMGELSGKPNEFALLHHVPGFKAHRLLMTGAGPKPKFTSTELRNAAGAAVRFLKGRSIKNAAFLLPNDLSTSEHVAAVAEGALIGNYEYDAQKSDKSRSKFLDSMTIAPQADEQDLQKGLERGIALGEGQNFARDLAAAPPNVLNPTSLAERARAMAQEAGLECEVLDQDRMRQLGMGALLGVAQGSVEPPALIVIRYKPEGYKGKVNVGLVGKGVTFDTGGISIKPSEKMDQMKYDMCGGAAVIGAMQAIAKMKPPVAVTALVPAVENMPGGRAQRPGDIVTSLSGKTIEVLNTDAEGRLILADALTYAQRIGCTHLVDAATLTGAIVVALGHHNTGVFASDNALLDRWMHAAKHEGERMWNMPLEPEYREQLKSEHADIANIGGRDGGAITAAAFLKEFAGDAPWIHLDIAGTAWTEDTKPYMAKGPTGVCVRSFVELAAAWRD
jgi:leucyl aminopeptidase